jgi:hypothetical protein
VHVETEIAKSLADATTYYDACRLWHDLNNGADSMLRAFRSSGTRFKPVWRGQHLHDGWEIEVGTGFNQAGSIQLPNDWRLETATRRELKRQKPTVSSGRGRAYLNIRDTFKVFLGDVDKGRLIRLHDYCLANYGVQDYLIITPPSGTTDLSPLDKALRGCPYAKLSDLPEPPKGSAAGRTKTAKLYKYSGWHRRNTDTWPAATVDYAAGGVFVNVENLDASGLLPCSLDTLLSEAQSRGFTGPLYGVPASHRKQFANNSTGWTHLVDWLKARVQTELTQSYLQSIADNQAWAVLPDDFHRIHGRMRIKTPDLKSPAFDALALRAPRGSNNARYDLARQIGLDVALPVPSFDYTAIVAAFLARYPLLSHIGLDNIQRAGELAADYIKTVDLAYPA